MKIFARYGIGIYLVITLLFKVYFVFPAAITKLLYIVTMLIGVLLLPFYTKFILTPRHQKAFAILYWIMLLNFIYLLLFDRQLASVLYFLSKLSTTVLIVLGIRLNYAFYKENFIRFFKYAMLALMMMGYMFGEYGEDALTPERLSMGFNPNDLGLFGVLGVLSIITLNKVWSRKVIDMSLVMVFLVLTLMSGSKSALLNLGICMLLVYGFSMRAFGISLLFLIAVFISSELGYITSIERLTGTEPLMETRDEVFEIGMMTFKDAFWLGHGLDKYGWTEPRFWPFPELAMGPHNTFLSIGIMYGVIFGSLFLLSILIFMIKNAKAAGRSPDRYIRFCYYVAVLCVVNGSFETLIVGVNEFVTLLFWFAIGCIASHKILNKQLC